VRENWGEADKMGPIEITSGVGKGRGTVCCGGVGG